MSISKQHLSEGDGNGEGVAITATASAGTTIHTAGTDKDEVHLYLSNIDTNEQSVIIEFGGTDTKNRIAVKVPPGESICALPGVPLSGSKLVKAYCPGGANLVNAFGWVNRIS